jgi:predicted dithiol-disulfide oxidoreductase (DUF899 family)
MKTQSIVTPAKPEANFGNPRVVSRDQWVAERKALLAREKELTRLRDQIARERRALPWMRIDKDYVFEAPQGPRTLAELFDGHRQLLVQHFMLAPGWQQGCPSCSFMADHADGMTIHLAHRDVTSWRSRVHRSLKSSVFASAWAGSSRGYPRMARTLTTTFASASRQRK